MPTQSAISRHGRTIAVFGASGHTGRFVVAQLLRRGFAPLAIGRDSAKLTGSGFSQSGVPIRSPPSARPAPLCRAFPAVVEFLTAPGPFLDPADAVAAAALRAGIHY